MSLCFLKAQRFFSSKGKGLLLSHLRSRVMVKATGSRYKHIRRSEVYRHVVSSEKEDKEPLSYVKMSIYTYIYIFNLYTVA